eukprot:CAMPEP_0201274746 /NCGR_PEP_ID=MMETSP0853-20130426/50279_1 /ASSEMBLY_ACC=CAM_ASM_000640 /TAXON_ID=183588 /ORGANISM="Pseudo-nitzschia fraudulenta, Strain WWA7" /LENGTH=154 /DNA_ID=CAMNT_0047582211 /DNA_START=832 /DNA_END=1296 /DNA_ORIENTATION=-
MAFWALDMPENNWIREAVRASIKFRMIFQENWKNEGVLITSMQWSVSGKRSAIFEETWSTSMVSLFSAAALKPLRSKMFIPSHRQKSGFIACVARISSLNLCMNEYQKNFCSCSTVTRAKIPSGLTCPTWKKLTGDPFFPRPTARKGYWLRKTL